jgi:hypothetical protein
MRQLSKSLTKEHAIASIHNRGVRNAFITLIASSEPRIQHLVCGAATVRAGDFMSATSECRATVEARDRPWDAQYRARARTLRKLARWTKSPEVRRDLMALALRHERMANYIETHSDDMSRARTAAPE